MAEHVKQTPEQPIHFTVSSCSSCANEAGLLALGSSLPEHEVLDGWKSGPRELFPQELVLDLDPGTLQLLSMRILSHETLIPTKIDVVVDGKFLLSLPFSSRSARGGANVREQKIVKLRKLMEVGSSAEADRSNVRRVRLVIHGAHADADMNPFSQVQLPQIVFTGISRHHHYHHHHHIHSSRKDARADKQLHQMGLASLAEAQVHERGVGVSDGANEVLAALDDDVDTSTGMILDMLRRQKQQIIDQRGNIKSKAKKTEAQRVTSLFKAFDRIGKAITRAHHLKKNAVKSESFDEAATASDKLVACFDARDMLAKREGLRVWCCGGENMTMYEEKILSMLDCGQLKTMKKGLSIPSPYVKALQASNLTRPPFHLIKQQRQASLTNDDSQDSSKGEGATKGDIGTKQEGDNEGESKTTRRRRSRRSSEPEEDLDPLKKWCISLLQFHFGAEGVLYAQGIKKPAELDASHHLQGSFHYIFGDYLTRSLLDRKIWLLRQAGCAVIQCVIDDETGFLRKHITQKKISPVDFFQIVTKVIIMLSLDLVAAVFKQCVDTTISLFSILWTEVDEQRQMSVPVIDSFVKRIADKNKIVQDQAAEVLLFFASCEYVGPVMMVSKLTDYIKHRSSRCNPSIFLRIVKSINVILDTFGTRRDPAFSPAQQALSVERLSELATFLVENRHAEVRKAGIALALKIYRLDITNDAACSRHALGIDDESGVADLISGKSILCFRTKDFAKELLSVDKECGRKQHESDKSIAAGVYDESEDPSVQALKKQIAEMRNLMKQMNKTEGQKQGKKRKKQGAKQKSSKVPTPRPPPSPPVGNSDAGTVQSIADVNENTVKITDTEKANPDKSRRAAASKPSPIQENGLGNSSTTSAGNKGAQQKNLVVDGSETQDKTMESKPAISVSSEETSSPKPQPFEKAEVTKDSMPSNDIKNETLDKSNQNDEKSDQKEDGAIDSSEVQKEEEESKSIASETESHDGSLAESKPVNKPQAKSMEGTNKTGVPSPAVKINAQSTDARAPSMPGAAKEDNSSVSKAQEEKKPSTENRNKQIVIMKKIRDLKLKLTTDPNANKVKIQKQLADLIQRLKALQESA